MMATFDFDRIADDLEMESEDILHLMTIYQKELPKDLTDLEQSLRECDWPLFKNKLHKMKGDAANLYLNSLAETFALMEHASINQDPHFLWNQINTVITLKAQFNSAFQNYSEKAR